MSSRKKAKKYKVETIEDFGNVVTEENFMDLMTAFGETIGVLLQMRKKVSSIKLTSFEWIDDGKPTVKKIIAKNTDTSEVLEITNVKRKSNHAK